MRAALSYRAGAVLTGGTVIAEEVGLTLEKLEGSNEDQAIGIKILSRSIEGPLRQIVANAGEYGDMGMYKVARPYRSMNEAREATPGPFSWWAQLPGGHSC